MSRFFRSKSSTTVTPASPPSPATSLTPTSKLESAGVIADVNDAANTKTGSFTSAAAPQQPQQLLSAPVATGAQGMPARDVVDGWFDEIMASLGPRASRHHPRVNSPPHLTTESKWELVRAYRLLNTTPTPASVLAKPPHADPKLSAKAETKEVVIREQGATPQAIIAALGCAVAAADRAAEGENTGKVVWADGLLWALKALKVALGADLAEWPETFLCLGGLEHLGSLLMCIADKAERTAEDWAVYTEILRALRCLARTRETIRRLGATPSVLTGLTRTLFGSWRGNHPDHPTHLDGCAKAGLRQLEGCCGGGRHAHAMHPGSAPPPVAAAADPHLLSRQRWKKKDSHNPISRYAEPSPTAATTLRPPLPARTLGLEILIAMLEHNGAHAWSLIMGAFDALTASDSASVRTATELAPRTLLPWGATFSPVVLARSQAWGGYLLRRREAWERLQRETKRPAIGCKMKPVSAEDVDPAMAVGEEAAAEEARCFLDRNLDFVVALMSCEETVLATASALNHAGLKQMLMKLHLSPDASTAARVNAFHLLHRRFFRLHSRLEIEQFCGYLEDAHLSLPPAALSRSPPYPPLEPDAPPADVPSMYVRSASGSGSDWSASDDDEEFAGDGGPQRWMEVV
ncbi:hypothetical protein HDU86_006268 [Geranomyces michiganensis]|nr:hypothetical protein HDU86_006268 [Geranomyces michiganensis]